MSAATTPAEPVPGEFLPQPFDENAPLFSVTVAARLADMHPQTLRGYDRLGLVVPTRSKGRGRRYTLRNIQRLRHIQALSQSEGINLEGIRRILALEEQVDQLQEQAGRLMQLLRRADETVASRTFTAGTTGLVHLGHRRDLEFGDLRLRALTTGD